MSPQPQAGPSSHPQPAPVPYEIDNGRIKLLETIGSGAYGVVWLGADAYREGWCPRAVKAIRRTGLDARQRHFQDRELALHAQASAHPGIVAMDRIVEEGDNTYVVMEYGQDGDLFGMICDKRRYVGNDELIRDIFLQLVDGVEHLHRLGISHRDIKPENIVCSEGGLRVQICDFGLATKEPISSEFGCGSSFYIAPEVTGEWSKAPSYPTRPGDIWSLGVILVNLICGRNPWRQASPSDESFNLFLNDPRHLRKILPVSYECLELLVAIFELDPFKRINIRELRKRVMAIGTFTMSSHDLQVRHRPSTVAAAVHAAGPVTTGNAELHVQIDQPEDAYDEDDEDDDDVFGFDQDPPALQEDDGSTSPPTDRSRSSSSLGGWAPRTPSFHAEDDKTAFVSATAPGAGCKPSADAITGLLKVDGAMWDLLKPASPSPQYITPGGHGHGHSPFFAQTAI